MQLPLPTYAGSKFTWSRNHGVAEASDLECGTGKIPGSKIYDDAADYGFMVIGNTKNLIFSFIGEDRDREGDITGFRYKSLCGTVSILIIND
jgi:hypothetical protein